MSRRPLIWFVLCYVGGSAAAAGLSPRGMVYAGGAAVLMAAAGVLFGKASPRLAIACLLAAGLAAGERLWADAHNVTALPELMAAAQAEGPRAAYEAEAEGVIVSVARIDGDRVSFRVRTERLRVKGDAAPRAVRERLLVQVRLAEQPEQAVAAGWKRGDRVVVAGELAQPAEATNSGGFDYRRYLRSQRIHWLLKAKGAASVKAAAGPAWSAAAMLGRVDAVRDSLGARMNALYPSDQSGYMKGLVLGIREDLDPEQFQQFSRLGLTHILAISGLHVAVFLYALGAMLRLARLTRERTLLLLTLAVPLYVLLSGASPSVMRAGIMAILGLLAARMGKFKDGLHLLAAAALAMLIYDPYFLENVSFQLSFIVTAGLIVGVAPVRKAMPQWRRGKPLLDLAAVTLVAQLVSFPITIYYFNQLHLLSLPANFILVPLISFVVMPIGAVALIIGSFWEGGGQALAYVSHYANDWTFALVEKLAAADMLRTIWASPPLWWVAAWLVALGITFHGLNQRVTGHPADDNAASGQVQATMAAARLDTPTIPLPIQDAAEWPDPLAELRQRFDLPAKEGDQHNGFSYKKTLIPLILLSIFGILLFWAYEPNRWDNKAIVSVIDVWQGDAIHIRTPEGKHLLIDGGGTLTFAKPGEEWRARSDPFEVGRKLLVPLLMKRGVREIDALVITHLDSDHIRGLQAVVESIPVKSIWWNGTVKQAEDAQELIRTALAKRIPMYAVHAGMKMDMDANTNVQVLWPPRAVKNDIVLGQEQNEISVVLALRLYDQLFVLSGDINTVTEQAIIDRLQDTPEAIKLFGHAAVLKVAHHGSRYSTSKEWLDYWRPMGAVASVGATNSYGHPHPDVLARLDSAGVRLWRTDVDGEVSFSVSRHGLLIRS
ncbi:ComEC/Rec2 family competence protein [Paenibacillus harenae]|uniref:ComEC/Rec2 family competence protein n=1 Tax=Paenibacillus harenae TaxID=306543 RepID=UPI002793BDBE|nr:ComEC/Rec2 family competence protein [Paenibacillus harenae]MDQ0058403.1 competence protein ComEC [Paenibacillus harenae]